MQARLAEVYETENPRTHTEAMLKAGYSPASARASAKDLRDRPGVKHATEALQARQRDKARGLDRMIQRGIEDPTAFDSLPAYDQVVTALKAVELKSKLNVEPETGDADRYLRQLKVKNATRRYWYIRMHVTGIGPLGWRAPQHLVVDPENTLHNTTSETTIDAQVVDSE
jgi:hypothetical protein